MENEFDKAIKFIIESEAVYKNGVVVSELEPGDDGGLTKWGVDQRSHPDVDIQNLTYEGAVEIYRTEYWEKSRADQLPYPLSLVHVDGAVNVGIGQQTKFLQRVCGAEDDGDIGPKTLAAVMYECKARGAKVIAKDVIVHREKFYKNLASTKPEKKRFLNGWLNRLNKLKTEVELA